MGRRGRTPEPLTRRQIEVMAADGVGLPTALRKPTSPRCSEAIRRRSPSTTATSALPYCFAMTKQDTWERPSSWSM